MDDTIIDLPETHSAHSVTLQKMIVEQLQPDIFDPPHHKLKPGIQSQLDTLLKEYESQFAKDETFIRTTSLTEMTINTGNADPISQKPYPTTMKNYQWVKEEIEKLLTAKVIHSSRSSWSAPIIVVLNDLRAGYHHIPLDKFLIPKTAFNSTFGKYECIKVPFGLAQAPAYFQELMTGILKDFIFAKAYLDDIIIFSRTAEEHLITHQEDI